MTTQRAKPPDLADNRPPLPLGRSRSHVLEQLAAAAGHVGVAELADAVGLHPNTVRFHLDALVEAGLASCTAEDADRPGRPRMLYQAAPDSPMTGQRSYQLLAEILASHLAARSRRPAADAAAAGREWGRYLAPPKPPFQRIDADTAATQLLRILTEIGFAPEFATTGRHRTMHLHHCPFREIAAQHGQVVCSVHLGLIQGFLAEIDAPFEAYDIESFVEPTTCNVHLVDRRSRTPRRTSSIPSSGTA